MTQPVQEPSTERNVQALNWRTAQLARRPPLVNAQSTALANAYVLTFQSYDVVSGSYSDLDGADWDETYTNEAAEVIRPGETSQTLVPQVSDGRIQINPGSGNIMICEMRLHIDWNIDGVAISATDTFYLCTGVNQSSGEGQNTAHSLCQLPAACVLAINSGQDISYMEGFYAGEAPDPTAQFVEPVVAHNKGSTITDAVLGARFIVQEICTFNFLDGTFGPGT